MGRHCFRSLLPLAERMLISWFTEQLSARRPMIKGWMELSGLGGGDFVPLCTLACVCGN